MHCVLEATAKVFGYRSARNKMATSLARAVISLLVLLQINNVWSAPLEGSLGSRHGNPKSHWVDIWATMPQLVEPYNLPPTPFNSTDAVMSNATIRQTLRVTLNADKIRLRVSNAFGVNDLTVTSVAIGLPADQKLGTSVLQQGSSKKVTFSGNQKIVIPNGALAVSDPIDLPVKAQSTLLVDIYLAQGQRGNWITGHPGSRTTSWLSFGDWVGASNFTDSSALSTDHWYFISAIEAPLPPSTSSFAIVGDSITDGRGSDTNKNNRWPDRLNLRMQKHRPTSSIALLNQAAGGNRILADGLGPNTLSRIDRDVLAHSGVRYAMIFEGVNDIGVAADEAAAQKDIGDRLLVAYAQIATRVQAAGIPIFGATVTPFGSPASSNYTQPYSGVEREKTRQRVNEWIRSSGVFDAVLDFDKALRDPRAPDQLAERFDSGDHLHPNVKGYQALADYFPLNVFDV
ncbi:SGNH/GDSL hydrolase family protein [Aspergillus clavatus NRRL 1]|uniref:Extracellular GDSL-like lipase/acylhydrolase, putative n=1 Tax=Aspergillus clavatus (strain ATCC 1007 / CBS 513.65 / DSM 816 / NCTC 3887 / NRRL 1 / QM 1276 / 107) TaxID=344612 RepID=A1CFS4_ASPCL|nr:extracellular GDSL-like lipase/acylhydrolase, putative [Aspergillus clavatus NRRL 1]EAW11723.1 extracellular GDSL-like lipase/acylhydrolase, putative [Aspergillus clavatus NRRL 1]